MKNIIFAFFVLTASFGLTACEGNAQNAKAVTAANRVEVIDFHSTHRCMTCNNIEQKAKATLEKHFAKELQSGKLAFMTVNVDEQENATMAESFEAFGTALFVHLNKGGQSKKVDLTDFAFMNANSKGTAFEDGLTKQVREALQQL